MKNHSSMILPTLRISYPNGQVGLGHSLNYQSKAKTHGCSSYIKTDIDGPALTGKDLEEVSASRSDQ